MHPRSNNIEIFSTFLLLDGNRLQQWVTDGRLRQSMQRVLQESPQEYGENFWAIYWHKLWQSQSRNLPQAHLTAYLQEACFWVARKTANNLTSTQYKLADCFQIAIAQVEKILKGFNPQQGFSLKNYASAIFITVIRENLRQSHEMDICSEWGLLRKTSQKRLQEALQAISLPRDTITNYTSAWQCFKSLYAPTQPQGSRKLPPPDAATWEAIATAYNQKNSENITPQTLETWLLNIAKALRRYLHPPVTSINISTSGETGNELIDNIPSNQQESLLSEIITQEEESNRDKQQAEIHQLLTTALTQLEPQTQEILQLYYTQALTQQEIAQKLALQQYTVSRRLTKTRETLLKTLAQWSQQTLHISLNSDILKSINTVMEEWLQGYFGKE
ncbi:sigma-70 family RNA polymerase sigma factor [Calothrix sp. 336/3]|uniref:sigma-70 family RNA polymerase sigma factor n=1 Tax=Calothrix sp. 336/3 TaxID=1337936 RepID=UPI0004E39A49|nr:sigma-70 family RNA polymerase sigma factor [Calothrix sp. 336/3]AKG20685.1 group 3/4 sigma-70 RNA polymerase sigma factor [Calothrix sp. 336/3]